MAECKRSRRGLFRHTYRRPGFTVSWPAPPIVNLSVVFHTLMQTTPLTGVVKYDNIAI